MKKINLILLIFPIVLMSQTTTENYVKNISYQVASTTGNVSNDDKIETITYFDGLERPIQNIAKQAGGNKQDIIYLCLS